VSNWVKNHPHQSAAIIIDPGCDFYKLNTPFLIALDTQLFHNLRVVRLIVTCQRATLIPLTLRAAWDESAQIENTQSLSTAVRGGANQSLHRVVVQSTGTGMVVQPARTPAVSAAVQGHLAPSTSEAEGKKDVHPSSELPPLTAPSTILQSVENQLRDLQIPTKTTASSESSGDVSSLNDSELAQHCLWQANYVIKYFDRCSQTMIVEMMKEMRELCQRQQRLSWQKNQGVTRIKYGR
jgi:hypothetical protein